MSLNPKLNMLLERAWSARLLPEPRLEAEHLVETALRQVGETAFVGEAWQEPFRLLVHDLRHEADLNPIGRTIAYGQITKLLRQRLRAAGLWRRHPEIFQQELAAPIVVLGHMRSGTTRLQRLLACDRRLSHTRFFEMFAPAPRGTIAGLDLRLPGAWLALQALHRLNPALAAIHPSSVMAPEEEFGLFSISFYGAQLEAQWRLPGFTRYWETADRAPVYREFRQLLQTIAWARGEAGRRPWLLKAPQIMEDLDLFLSAFPDARLICLSRDLADVVGSSASLVWNQMRVQSDSTDQHRVGREWLEKTVRRERLAHDARARHAHVPQIDLTFEAMNENWRNEMARIYDFLGMALTPETKRRMRAYLASAEKSGFRKHRYTLEDYGLSREIVEKAFGPAGGRSYIDAA